MALLFGYLWLLLAIVGEGDWEAVEMLSKVVKRYQTKGTYVKVYEFEGIKIQARLSFCLAAPMFVVSVDVDVDVGQ